MLPGMTANELQLAKAFREAGFEQDKAEAVAETIFAAIRDNVATKADLNLLEQSIQTELTKLKLDLTIRMGVIAAATVGILASVKFFG